jgi:hypothetical protein
MSNYSVIFEGNISDGHQIQDVKRKMGTLFKIDDKRVDLLFAKPKIVLKKGLDYDSAQKYRHAILSTGALCNVKAEAESSSGLDMEKAAAPDAGLQAMKQSVPPPLPGAAAVAGVQDTAQMDTVASDEASSGKRSHKGIGDIIAGVVIIGIGFSYGGSVFLGNPGLLDYCFDGLGVFWVGRGIFKLVRG